MVEQLAQRERVVRGVAPGVHQRHRQLRVRRLAEALAAAAAAAATAVALEKGLDLLEGGAVRLAQHAVDLLLELGRADLVRGLRGGGKLVGHAWCQREESERTRKRTGYGAATALPAYPLLAK